MVVLGLGIAIGVVRLRTGSVWPAVAMHAAWNAIIQGPFDRSSVGPGATVWVGESGILVAVASLLAGLAVYYWRWDKPSG
jgi:membrane protease YdiL (CAAX protease family)